MRTKRTKRTKRIVLAASVGVAMSAGSAAVPAGGVADREPVTARADGVTAVALKWTPGKLP